MVDPLQAPNQVVLSGPTEPLVNVGGSITQSVTNGNLVDPALTGSGTYSQSTSTNRLTGSSSYNQLPVNAAVDPLAGNLPNSQSVDPLAIGGASGTSLNDPLLTGIGTNTQSSGSVNGIPPGSLGIGSNGHTSFQLEPLHNTPGSSSIAASGQTTSFSTTGTVDPVLTTSTSQTNLGPGSSSSTQTQTQTQSTISATSPSFSNTASTALAGSTGSVYLTGNTGSAALTGTSGSTSLTGNSGSTSLSGSIGGGATVSTTGTLGVTGNTGLSTIVSTTGLSSSGKSVSGSQIGNTGAATYPLGTMGSSTTGSTGSSIGSTGSTFLTGSILNTPVEPIIEPVAAVAAPVGGGARISAAAQVAGSGSQVQGLTGNPAFEAGSQAVGVVEPIVGVSMGTSPGVLTEPGSNTATNGQSTMVDPAMNQNMIDKMYPGGQYDPYFVNNGGNFDPYSGTGYVEQYIPPSNGMSIYEIPGLEGASGLAVV
ncbi:hypothetical protein LOTGIDRAFT_152730 [Lottia gigantea]|uniref:Uncharacterized protein n=1 Tax=Lottia gigantea TaxID=225164 RepID=V4C7G9_LOTGI|nr:hypothetical protein LOTGIDRAFT_152730 [Lottia gigantea]ESO97639.1 hypothetical protein LOTGIDRAFT_152730 [Lottia gigantea]